MNQEPTKEFLLETIIKMEAFIWSSPELSSDYVIKIQNHIKLLKENLLINLK